MNVNISDAGKGGARTVTVSDETGEMYSGPAKDTAHAHKIVKIGAKHGWDSKELADVAKAK